MMAKLASNSIVASFSWKDNMFCGCTCVGEEKMVEGGAADDMGELREEEIVWGEEMETPLRYKGSGDHHTHPSMLSMQGFATWSGISTTSNSKVGKGALSKSKVTMQKMTTIIGDEEEGEEEKEEGGIEELPPHELVAREYAATTFSVLQGAGRTLKGMDLRRLRNEVWRQIGFVD